MASRNLAITSTPIEIVAALSLDNGDKIRVTASTLVAIGEGDRTTPAVTGHPLYPSSGRAKHDVFLEVEADVGIWVWTRTTANITVSKAL